MNGIIDFIKRDPTPDEFFGSNHLMIINDDNDISVLQASKIDEMGKITEAFLIDIVKLDIIKQYLRIPEHFDYKETLCVILTIQKLNNSNISDFSIKDHIKINEDVEKILSNLPF